MAVIDALAHPSLPVAIAVAGALVLGVWRGGMERP